ncbi:MAG: trypsin-like peptidase domain-containing protein, partial [Phycisphaerales bacterium]|nr:trypsin-like peptidase domain-containing protein [Phycisphaerales bacterium]
PPVGSEVTCISHPKGRLFSLTHGLVSRFFQTSNRIKGKKTAKTIMMTVTADYAAGSSGGPIFGPNGNIAGVVSSTYSAYYSMKKGIARDLQMVFKQTIPVSQIHKLIKK